jgi:hypothetical protein
MRLAGWNPTGFATNIGSRTVSFARGNKDTIGAKAGVYVGLPRRRG